MAVDHFARHFPVICAGFGLLLAGGVNLLLMHRGFLLRTVGTLAAVGIAITAVAASTLGVPGMTSMTARLLVLVLIPFLILGSRWFIAAINVVTASLHRPGVRFSLLAFVGVATMVGSIVAYEGDDDADEAADKTELQLLHGPAASIPTNCVEAATDRGTQLILREPVGTTEEQDLASAEERILHHVHLSDTVLRRGAADDRSNCHGWVFTDGRFLLSSADVELILKENGYREQHEPRPGDLVIYRQSGVIVHSGIVRYVTAGQPVLVESKWGELGVFLHPVDKSVYGQNYTFHRSARSGHLLAGVAGAAAGCHQPLNGPVE